jgi:hypothetical protein
MEWTGRMHLRAGTGIEQFRGNLAQDSVFVDIRLHLKQALRMLLAHDP